MAAVFKRQKPWAERVKPGQAYPVDEALALVKEFANAKFDETVDVAINLGIDPAKSDQQVRGSTVMPNGTGKRCASPCSRKARMPTPRARRAPTSWASRTSRRR
jgi:ribosomal protein L1